MKTTAKELRRLVIANALEMGRISRDTIGAEDYKELTGLYRDALDAITEWASANYNHTTTPKHKDNAFKAAKAVLEVFATDENRIFIDEDSMLTLRDNATKPATFYSDDYRDANRAQKKAEETLKERTKDLLTLGAPARNDGESTEDYVARIRAYDIVTKVGEVDMVDLYVTAESVAIVKAKAVQDIKDAGKWHWRRAKAVSLSVFADLVENYIADCLESNYNMKSSKTIREEQAAAREAKKNA